MKMRLTRSRLIEMLEAFKSLRVGVIGDFALDAYWYADMTISEISRETPLYVRPVVRETYSPGGASNVANNVAALGVGRVFAVTVIGEDWRGSILRGELEKAGVSLEYAVASTERVTQTYVKPILLGYDVQQEDSRIDFINVEDLPQTLESQLISNLEKCVSKVDVLLVADYLERGVLTENVRRRLNEIALENPEKIFVADSRTRIGEFRGMALKPNKIEAIKAVYPEKDPRRVSLEELKEIGLQLWRRVEKPVSITIGDAGALIFTEDGCLHVPAAPTEPPMDFVGAGDTFLAAFGSSLGVEAHPWEAAAVANLAASVILKKLNITGTASPHEILTKFDEVRRVWKSWPSPRM